MLRGDANVFEMYIRRTLGIILLLSFLIYSSKLVLKQFFKLEKFKKQKSIQFWLAFISFIFPFYLHWFIGRFIYFPN